MKKNLAKKHLTAIYLLSMLAISTLSQPSVASANEPYHDHQTPENIESLFDMDIGELLTINISVASRSALSLSDAPASISVFTASDIQLMGITHLDQLLNFVPGFLSAREDQTRSNVVTVRGRRINNFNPDILVMIDSMPINNPVSGGGLYNISELRLGNIKQVEIIRGPGSALYGSNAFSAVINLISDKTTEFVSLTMGEDLNYDGTLKLNHEYNEFTFSSYFQLSSDSGQLYQPIFNYYGSLDPVRDPSDNQTAQLSFSYRQFTATLNWSERIARHFIHGGVPDDGSSMDRSGRFIHLKYQQTPTQQLSIDWFAEHSRTTQDERLLVYPARVAAFMPFGWTDGSHVDFIGGNRRQAKQWRVGFDGQWLQNNQLQWQFGLFAKNQSTSRNVFHGNWDAQRLEQSVGQVLTPSTTGVQSGYWMPDGTRLDLIKPFNRDIQGAYLQGQWQINQDNQFTGGLRYDHYQYQHGNLSFRGALVHHLSDTQNLKLLYGEAFRAPTIQDTQAEFSSAIFGNPALKPERVKTFDIIWQQTWQNLLISSNLFYSTIHDEVVVEVTPIEGGFTPLQAVNKGTKTLSGLEFELQAKLAENYRLKAGLSWFNHQQGLGSAKALAFMSLNMNFDPLQININGHYHAKVLSRDGSNYAFDDYIYLDGYANFNLNASYQYHEDIEVFFTINNLTDKQYYTYSTTSNIEHGLPQRNRHWQLGFKWKF